VLRAEVRMGVVEVWEVGKAAGVVEEEDLAVEGPEAVARAVAERVAEASEEEAMAAGIEVEAAMVVACLAEAAVAAAAVAAGAQEEAAQEEAALAGEALAEEELEVVATAEVELEEVVTVAGF
jgi:uncharacterized metal-binding protein YceD (DUF177 family)